ncbi:NUDIX hydrolase [Candidatus Nomurabacteria bacterium]|nr:NUDIX hydrolase [Candidatus Nomurabacteria bacterium]
MNIPKFIDKGKDAPREDVETIERDAVTVIVRNPKNQKYLALRWKKLDWETFITGGIEEGQTPEQASREEVKEETGYVNLSLIKELPPYDALFYHGGKKVNRLAHFKCFLFELIDEEQVEVSQEEKERHEAIWLTREELENFNLPDGHRHTLENI